MEEAADSVDRLYSHNLIWAATTLEWIESIKDDEDVNTIPLLFLFLSKI